MPHIPDPSVIRPLRSAYVNLISKLRPQDPLREIYARVTDSAAEAESPSGWLRAHAANPSAPSLERGAAENLLAAMKGPR